MQEYYTFGESTWDLVLFIGTGALGEAPNYSTHRPTTAGFCMLFGEQNRRVEGREHGVPTIWKSCTS